MKIGWYGAAIQQPKSKKKRKKAKTKKKHKPGPFWVNKGGLFHNQVWKGLTGKDLKTGSNGLREIYTSMGGGKRSNYHIRWGPCREQKTGRGTRFNCFGVLTVGGCGKEGKPFITLCQQHREDMTAVKGNKAEEILGGRGCNKKKGIYLVNKKKDATKVKKGNIGCPEGKPIQKKSFETRKKPIKTIYRQKKAQPTKKHASKWGRHGPKGIRKRP